MTESFVEQKKYSELGMKKVEAVLASAFDGTPGRLAEVKELIGDLMEIKTEGTEDVQVEEAINEALVDLEAAKITLEASAE